MENRVKLVDYLLHLKLIYKAYKLFFLQSYSVKHKVPRMKVLNVLSLKILLLSWERRIVCSCSTVSSYVSTGRKSPTRLKRGSYLFRHLIWRFKSQWKQALRWERNTVQYSYDPGSYSKNFDDGCSQDDHLSPLAPRARF